MCKNKITALYKLILKESILAILQMPSTMRILGRFLPGSQGVHRFYTASVETCQMPTFAGNWIANWRCRPRPVIECTELIAAKGSLVASVKLN